MCAQSSTRLDQTKQRICPFTSSLCKTNEFDYESKKKEYTEICFFYASCYIGIFKKSISCSDPYPIYISNNSVSGSQYKNKIEYLKKIYTSPVVNDSNNNIRIAVQNIQNHHAIPINVRIINLSKHESCSKIDIYVESMFKEENSEEFNFYYKVATFIFFNSSIPYISTRIKAMSEGNYVKVIAVATIKSHDKHYLIQSESPALNLYRCNSYRSVNTEETALKNNNCIEAPWME